MLNRQFMIMVNGVRQFAVTVSQDVDPLIVAEQAREAMHLQNVNVEIGRGLINFQTTGGL